MANQYPRIDTVNQFGVLSVWDSIKIAGLILPLTPGTLRGGISLNVERRKQKGTDFARFVSQGLDSDPIGFQLMLVIDYSKTPPRNWLDEYSKIEKLLCPRSFDERNAIEIYHPSLAGAGTTRMIPTRRPLVIPQGPDVWTVDIEGIDVQFFHGPPSGVTKKVEQAPLRTSGPATVPKPSKGLEGKVPPSPNYRG